MQNGKLHISLNKLLTGRLDHWHFNTFQLVYDQFWNGTDPVSFSLDAQGKVAKLIWGGAELSKVPEGLTKGVAGR